MCVRASCFTLQHEEDTSQQNIRGQNKSEALIIITSPTHSLLAVSRRGPSQSPLESVGENRLGAPPSQLHLFVVCETQRGGQRSNKFTGTPGLSHVNAPGPHKETHRGC